MEFIEIIKSGTPAKPINEFTDLVKETMSSTVGLYEVAGYFPPWIGYLALEEKQCAGTCAFKFPPENNRDRLLSSRGF